MWLKNKHQIQRCHYHHDHSGEYYRGVTKYFFNVRIRVTKENVILYSFKV